MTTPATASRVEDLVLPELLVEASPLDRVWGIGVAAGDIRAGQPSARPGRDLLGFALMRVRAMLRVCEPGVPG